MEIASIGEKLVKVTFTGRLDTQGVDRIEKGFQAAIVPEANSVIVDLSQVEFVASMGIRMFVSVAQNLGKRQARLALFGATALVKRVFETVSLQTLIPTCSTEAEALAAVSALQV